MMFSDVEYQYRLPKTLLKLVLTEKERKKAQDKDHFPDEPITAPPSETGADPGRKENTVPNWKYNAIELLSSTGLDWSFFFLSFKPPPNTYFYRTELFGGVVYGASFGALRTRKKDL